MKKNIFYFLSFIFLFYSCNNEDLDKQNDNENFSISQEEIKKIFQSSSKSTSSSKSFSITNEIESIIPLNDEVTKEPLIYIVNYREKGFLLLAADKRVEPVLAYSFNSKFILEGEIDQGLASWFEAKIDYIDYVKKNVREPLPEITMQWNNLHRARPLPEGFENPHGSCDFVNDLNYNYGPLLKTKWSQGSGFNNLMPQPSDYGGNIICQTGQLINNHFLAGCVPVAIAQILRYHAASSDYQWDLMSDYYGGFETSRLIKYIHTNIPITYTCTGTGVAGSVDKGAFFINKFNYSSAINSNWTDSSVRVSLKNNKPVYVEANTTKKILFGTIKVLGSGHAWVCDGVRESAVCYKDEYGNAFAIGGVSFHMNWGWSGNNDGYYSFGHFNTTNGDFNFKPKITYNITP